MIGRGTAVVLGLVFAIAGASQAAANCADYGATAVAQHNENLALGCGFDSLRWHSDGASHAAFCAFFGEDAAAVETGVRADRLTVCRGAQPADNDPPADNNPQVENDPPAQDGAIGEQDVHGEQDHDCKRSEVVEGKGATRQQATNAARDKLGLLRAQWTNAGLPRCRYNELGCIGENGDRTCWLSLDCCPR